MNNYDLLKGLSVYQLARFLEKNISLPFEIAILNKRKRISYVKEWLLSDIREN